MFELRKAHIKADNKPHNYAFFSPSQHRKRRSGERLPLLPMLTQASEPRHTHTQTHTLYGAWQIHDVHTLPKMKVVALVHGTKGWMYSNEGLGARLNERD